MGIVSLFVFGVITGPIAFFLGGKAERDIQESNGALPGEKKARWAKILGGVGFALWAVALVVNFTVRS